MASYCPNPNCKHKLKVSNWKANCPECGANILYYRMEDRLLAEADEVELSSAAFQKRIDRLKAAVFGNNWAIARLVLLFLPIGMLFLPLGRAVVNIPFVDNTTNLNIINIFKSITSLDFDMVFSFLGDERLSAAYIWLLLALVGVILVLVACLAGLICSVLAGGKKAMVRAAVICGVGMAGTILGAIALTQYGANLADLFPGAISTAVSFGAVALAASFLIGLGINIVIKTQGGIPIQYTQCYISGFPEEEVLANLENGITLDDMRAAQAEKAAQEALQAEPAEPPDAE